MNVTEAAKILDATKQHVRLLCRTGRLKAKQKVVKYPDGKKAYHWDITEAALRRFSLVPQRTGRPRGSKKEKPVLLLQRPADYKDTSILSQHLGRKNGKG